LPALIGTGAHDLERRRKNRRRTYDNRLPRLNARRARADPELMLIGVVLLICLASVPLARGRLGALADLRFRAGGLAIAAILAQVVIISILPDGARALHHVVHLGSYALLAVFLWLNRGVPYLWLAALGGGLNLIAIVANGGVMPADPDALAAAGLAAQAGHFANSTAVAHPHLAFLGDVFAVPGSLPVANVFSVGDVVLVVATLLALHCVCGSRLAAPRFAAPLAP
jgi:uncharacterized protein DUF5317